MAITWISGQSKSGKSTLAKRLKRNEIILDGDAMRSVWPGLGYSREDRWEQNLRVARLAKEIESQGFDVIVSTICPYRDLRKRVEEITGCRFIYLPGGVVSEDYPYEW